MERRINIRGAAGQNICDEVVGDERARPRSGHTTLHVLESSGDASTANADHFVEREGLRFAGTHLIIDLWRASHLDDIAGVEVVLRKAAQAASATLLKVELHRFAPSGGITGVAILAESHISIHTWPQCSYAAIDVFMCGDAKPHKAIDVLRHAFVPAILTVVEHKRGVVA